MFAGGFGQTKPRARRLDALLHVLIVLDSKHSSLGLGLRSVEISKLKLFQT